MFKWIARLFILGVILVLSMGIFAYYNLKSQHPPAIDEAPYLIQCYYEMEGMKMPTRYYYAENIKLNGNQALLMNYWRYDGDKYRNMKDVKVVQPPYDIIRRVK